MAIETEWTDFDADWLHSLECELERIASNPDPRRRNHPCFDWYVVNRLVRLCRQAERIVVAFAAEPELGEDCDQRGGE